MIIGKTQEAILDFMIAYPMKCYNTTMTQLFFELEPYTSAGYQTLYASFHRMIKHGLIERHRRHSKSAVSDFTINWNCHGLPSHILAKAPDHIKEAVKDTNEKLKSGEYKAVDAYGAGITKLMDELEPEPAELPAEPVVLPPLDDSPIMEAEPTAETPQPQPITVEPVVERTADGRSISVTLTINLNI